jgi:subtilisin family serine protease
MNVFDPADTWDHKNTIYGEQFNCSETDPYGNGGGTDPYGNGGGTDPYGNDNNSTPFTANDALIEDQWYLNNTGTAPDTWGQYKDLTQGADMRVFGAWNQGVSGTDIVVTISDDGVDFNHPDLTSQKKGSTSLQTLTTAAVGSDDHGTGCAGIIAAKADTDGVVGIAPNARLIAHQILGTYSLGNISTYTKMLNDDISQVSNHSYGPTDDGILYPQYMQDYDDIKNLVTQSNNGKGHVLLFASGNGRAYVPKNYQPSEISSSYSAYDGEEIVTKSYGDYAGLDMSQQNPFVISVSGFDANNKEVSYAEAGPAVLVAGATGNQAPGAQGFNKPEGATKLPSAAMATTGRAGVSYAEETDTPRDGTGGVDEPVGFNMAFNGTSAATPTVTGVVALIRSANLELSWRDVRWILAKTARKIEVGQNITNQATGKPSTGTFAKPIWSDSGNSEFGKYSHYFGYGAADATEAVRMAKDSNYTLLPTMKECNVNITANRATIPVGCPNKIEFVQVKFTATSGLKINDSTFTIQHNSNTGKVISLLVPTTCSVEEGCDINADTVAKTGTVGFMGDTLNSGDTFNFTISNSNASNTGDILPQEIKVFGFN